MRGTAEEAYDTAYPRPGWAEQQPEQWWAGLLRAGRRAVEEAGDRDIAGIAVATTASTVVVCRKDGTPIRPALLWMDCRAAREARQTRRVRHPVMAFSGGEDAAEWLVPKAMWLQRHEPEVFAEADVICEAIDFLNFRLGGEWAGSRMNASCKWNYDSATGAFVPEVYDALGIPALADKLPRRIVPVGVGAIFNWLAHTIFGLDGAGHQQLIAEAARLTPAETGLMVLDYWMGNRTPYQLAVAAGHRRRSWQAGASHARE